MACGRSGGWAEGGGVSAKRFGKPLWHPGGRMGGFLKFRQNSLAEMHVGGVTCPDSYYRVEGEVEMERGRRGWQEGGGWLFFKVS